MCAVLQYTRDPIWLKSLPCIAGTVIFLQGDDPDCQVSVPAALLIASSHLVRNILSAGHLPPAFSTPVISFPSVSVDILESVGEMLVLGNLSVNMTRLSGVREVFKMIGIEDWMVIDTESLVKDFDNEDTVRDLVNGKDHLDLENVKLEIEVKFEKESDAENAIFQLDQTTIQSNQSCFERKKIKNQNTSKEPHRIARLKNAGNLKKQFFEKSSGQKKKTKKQNFSSNIIQDKYSRKTKKSCPHCEKKIVLDNMSRHIRSVHNKETEQCPQCNKILSITALSCHISTVHNNETVQCPHCNKTLGIHSLSGHIRIVHKKVKRAKRTCPQCDKKFLGLSRHIKQVHSKETAQCPHCDKTLSYFSLARHVDTVHKED